MKVVVSGSSGLIGTALCDALRTQGHEPVRLVRREALSADEISWDPATRSLDATALRGADAVINLAGEGLGEKRWTPAQKQRLRSSRTQSTETIVTAMLALDAPPTVLINGSAIGFYGERGEEVLTESEPPGDDFLARLVTDWERSAQPASDAGIRTVFARTGIVLSTRGGALARQLGFFRAGLGGTSGTGTQYLAWISLADEVAALIWLLEHEISGPVNLTAPTPVTNRQFVKTLGGVLHRPTTIIPMVGPRLLFGRELADSLLLTSIRATPGVLESHSYPFANPDLAESLQAIIETKS